MKQTFICQTCEFTFSNQGNLNSHCREFHHKIRRFSCEECGYRTNRSFNLQRHEKANKCYNEKIFTPRYEEYVQKKLKYTYNGAAKKCETGIIDILYENNIVEVKNWKGWEKAIDQVISYANCYSKKYNKRLHFFGDKPDNYDEIVNYVTGLDIEITHEPFSSNWKQELLAWKRGDPVKIIDMSYNTEIETSYSFE